MELTIRAAARARNFNYAIRNIVRAAEELERKGRRVVYLNIGDPQAFGFRPPAHLTEAVARALRDDFTGYAHSTGLPEAREAVAAYASRLGAPTGPGDVLITSGASEAADLVLSALLDHGDEVLLPAPGYPLYPAIVSKLGARTRYYRVDETTGWLPSAEEVRSLITERTRALVLINPNNPTGRITPDEVTAELLGVAARHNLLVIADEVYREICFGRAPAPASTIAAPMDLPIVTLESLSKTHMVSGWRVGWLRYTHGAKVADLASAVVRLASGRLSAPTPAQYAVRPALDGGRSFLDEFVRVMKRRRDVAMAHVARISGLSCPEPEAAFYLMIKAHDLGGRSDESFVLDLLARTGVLVVHGSGFGADPRHGYFRLVYLAGEETLDLAFDALRSFVSQR